MQSYFCCITLVDADIPIDFFLGNLHFSCRTFIDNSVPYFFSRQSFFVAQLSSMMVFLSFFQAIIFLCSRTFNDYGIPQFFYQAILQYFCCITFIYDGISQLFFQATMSWTGLLVEPNSQAFNTLKSRNRKSTLINSCLSIHR